MCATKQYPYSRYSRLHASRSTPGGPVTVRQTFGGHVGLQDGSDRLDLDIARQYQFLRANDLGHLHLVT